MRTPRRRRIWIAGAALAATVGLATAAFMGSGTHTQSAAPQPHPPAAPEPTTPLDPVTARLHEGYWHFLPRAVMGEYRSAWALETERLRRQGQPWWSASNQMLQFQGAQALLAVGVLAVFGPWGLLAWLGAATVGYVLFQLVNYVEHYGLLRRQTAPGLYERVQPHHSWNSEYPLGRILLYELTRHSDHHYQAARPYHTLRHQPASPQMPTGYPGMMLLAIVPPLWFRVMNERVPTNFN